MRRATRSRYASLAGSCASIRRSDAQHSPATDPRRRRGGGPGGVLGADAPVTEGLRPRLAARPRRPRALWRRRGDRDPRGGRAPAGCCRSLEQWPRLVLHVGAVDGRGGGENSRSSGARDGTAGRAGTGPMPEVRRSGIPTIAGVERRPAPTTAEDLVTAIEVHATGGSGPAWLSGGV